MDVLGPVLRRQGDCEAILRSLPAWFGIEESLLGYARDTGTLPTFALEDGATLAGFVTLRDHFPAAWEIHCIAVAATARNRGCGSRLLAHAEAWLAGRGVQLLQVKTISASHPSTAYAETRAFYAGRGFLALEEFPLLWSPTNPVLQLVKAIGATKIGGR